MSQSTLALELLRSARSRFTQEEIAKYIGRDPKTVRRWEKGTSCCPVMAIPALRELLQPSEAIQNIEKERRFTFIDLFAGIGGIRMGFESVGGVCVFTSEWNDFAKKTYLENFPGNHLFVGDIVPYAAEDCLIKRA